jgi:hypothetical protein
MKSSQKLSSRRVLPTAPFPPASRRLIQPQHRQRDEQAGLSTTLACRWRSTLDASG